MQLSQREIFELVMPLMQACETYHNVDILRLVPIIPRDQWCEHMAALFRRLTDNEKWAIEQMVELAMTVDSASGAAS
jgi:hypothetical protein